MKIDARLACFAVTPLLLCALSGCATEAQQHAMQGKDSLDRCDLRGADTEFRAAYEADPSNPDFALAFALADIAVLPEDPGIVALAPRFGFDRAIDSSLLWGADGVLDRLSRHATCNAVEDVLTTRFPHPSLRAEPRPSFVSTIDSTVTLGDGRALLVQLSPRFHEIAEALVVAADGMSADGVLLPDGGCGFGSTPTRLQAPELYALAAGFEAIRAATQASLGYDGAMPFKLLFDPNIDEAMYASMMDAHVGRVTDASQVAASRPMFVHALELAHRAVAAARVAHHAPDAVFDWPSLPTNVLDDVDAMVTASQTALATDGPVAIPSLTPALGLDVGSFFTHPFDTGDAVRPLWSTVTDSFGTYVDFDDAAAQSLVAPRFDSDPFASTVPSRTWGVDWSTVTSTQWKATFDPGERWTSGYMCSSP